MQRCSAKTALLWVNFFDPKRITPHHHPRILTVDGVGHAGPSLNAAVDRGGALGAQEGLQLGQLPITLIVGHVRAQDDDRLVLLHRGRTLRDQVGWDRRALGGQKGRGQETNDESGQRS